METFSHRHPLLGVRVWALFRSQMVLRSIAPPEKWPPASVQHTVCSHMRARDYSLWPEYAVPITHKGDPGPHEGCECGLGAFYDDRLCLSSDFGRSLKYEAIVRGVVAGFGKTVLKPNEFRSRYMKVLALISDPRSPQLSEASLRYGVPLLAPEGVDEFMASVDGVVYWSSGRKWQ